MSFFRTAVACLTVVAIGCAGASEPPPAGDALQATEAVGGLSFVPAPADLRAKCQATARAVGYAVPCPTRVPVGLVASSGGRAGCELDIIGPGGQGDCAKSWRGWVVGSSDLPGEQHLIITAAPGQLRNYAKVVNGPAWYPKARVRPLGWVSSNGWRMRAVYATPQTNAGSAFMGHVVLIWTVRGHTYGVGFHNVHGLAQTLELNKALVRGITLIGP